MARPVYSTCFISTQLYQDTAQYLVPAGFTAVIRDVATLLLGNVGGSDWGIQVTPDGIYLAGGYWTSNDEFTQWTGRQVVTEGLEFGIYVNGDTAASVRVCGYLLSND